VFDRIHCSYRIHCSFGWFIGEFGRFIGKIGRHSSVWDFTVHILNQIDFGRFYQIRRFFLKTDRVGGGRFFSLRRFFKHWSGDGEGRKKKRMNNFFNQWHMQVIFLNFTRKLKIVVCEAPILLLHKTSKVGVNFTFLW
jgi:hypothetical protein